MPTENHGLNTPEKGKTGWHEPLNKNFESIDTILHRISADGTDFSPDSLTADEITLGGSTRSDWPSGDLFSTDPTKATDKIIVPDTAEDIQTAIDTLDGTVSGYEGGGGSLPGGGVIMLKRKEYMPESTLTMANGVRIVGCQPDMLLGRNNNEWQYSVLSGRKLPEGNAIVEYPEKGQHAGLHNLVIIGTGRDVHGIKINNKFGSTYHSNLVITRCNGSAIWTRGCLDTWLRDVSAKNNGTLAANNSFGYDAPSVRIESADDNLGGGSADTQIRWYGGRISGWGPVPAVEASSSLQRFYDCTLKLSAEPTRPTPVVDFSEGSFLELMRCTVDGYRNENVTGIRRGNNQLRLADSLVEKCGTGLAGPGNDQNMISNTKFRDFANYGLHFKRRGALISNVDIRDSAGDGIFVESANIQLPWSNVQTVNHDGYGIRISEVKGGNPGDVPIIYNFNSMNNGKGATNRPDLLIVDGKWAEPYTYELQGSDGTLSLSEKPANPLDIMVSPGGDGVSLRGFSGPTRGGKVVVAEHTGSGSLNLPHHDGSTQYPLHNSSGSGITLSNSGEMVSYRYDSHNKIWREMWRNAG